MPSLHPLALACVAALGLLLFGLGLAVSVARARSRVLTGVTGDPDAPLDRLVRAHGNTAEYAPFLALLFLVHGVGSPGPLALGLMAAATLLRALFVLGLLTARSLRRPSPLRFVGALGTYITGLALAALLLVA